MNSKIGYFLMLLLSIVSCKEEENQLPNILLPTTYNFTNVNYEGQKFRLAMLTEIVNEMKKGTIQQLDSNILINMYSNNSNPFTSTILNTSGKQLRDKTYSGDIFYFNQLFGNIASVSSSYSNTITTFGEAGVAISTTDATKKYLLNEQGVEYAQIIQKGLMGAIFYYRIAEEYTTKSKLDFADNDSIVSGEGTDMQHYWDEAFGYVGIPTLLSNTNYDSVKTAGLLSFYGIYMEKAKALNVPNNLLTAFIKGRDAINRKDYPARDEAAADIRKNLELIHVCSAISYLNQGQAALSDYAIKCHTLSEAYGFILALKYNSGKKISNSDYALVTNKFYQEDKLSIAHLTSTDITWLRDTLSDIYGLNAIKTTL